MPNLEKIVKFINFGRLRSTLQDISKVLEEPEYLDKKIEHIIKNRYFYLDKKINYEILGILIYLTFSNYFGKVVEYFSLTHPSFRDIKITLPKEFYVNIIRYCLKIKMPVFYYDNFELYVKPIPQLRTRVQELTSGLAATFIFIEGIFRQIEQRAKEEGLAKDEMLDDFVTSMTEDNKIMSTILRRYKTLENKFLSSSKQIQEGKFTQPKLSFDPETLYSELDEEIREYVTTEINDSIFRPFMAVPCLANIIIRSFNPKVELEHYERVVFLSVVQVFFTDEQIHEFFRYAHDYNYERTQKAINYTRNKFPIPNNCKGIIKRGYCPCEEIGCCGTTIYKAFRMPDEVKERIDEFYRENPRV